MRRAAAWSLGDTTEATALAALVALCRDGDSDVREAAAGALMGTTDPTALPVLVALCRDGHSDVRRIAAEALEESPSGSAVAQRLLAAGYGQKEPGEVQRLLFARLIPDDVPFADWPDL